MPRIPSAYAGGMPADVIAAIIAAALAIVGLFGIVIPVLPGSITILVGLFVWAIWGGSGWAWGALVIGGIPLVVGMVSGWILTKRGLDRKAIPGWPILVAVAVGIVGMFVLPALGLPIGFVIGLVVAEFVRLKDWREALDTSWAAMKTLGLGMLIELACAMFAIAVLTVSMLAHFFSGA